MTELANPVVDYRVLLSMIQARLAKSRSSTGGLGMQCHYCNDTIQVQVALLSYCVYYSRYLGGTLILLEWIQYLEYA